MHERVKDFLPLILIKARVLFKSSLSSAIPPSVPVSLSLLFYDSNGAEVPVTESSPIAKTCLPESYGWLSPQLHKPWPANAR